ncbi:MAG: carbohydrate ABC transporter permease [Arenicellales bacterium]|nr:carbohydrate ABC transporter permease [Arenicellales bacterium]
MAAVVSQRKKLANRIMIAAVLVTTFIMLIPIYWIATTSIKSFSDAVAVPPKIFFQPEMTGLVKVFTKRTQLRAPKYKITDQTLESLEADGVPGDVLVELAAVGKLYRTESQFTDAVNEALGPERATDYLALVVRYATISDPTPEKYADARWYEKLIYDSGEKILRASPYPNRLWNSVLISIVSTVLSVAMGTLTAYGFSRFRVKGEKDWLFFILSTRMLPPLVIIVPLFLMYRAVGLIDTHLGLIILYTAFNLSFSVWLMKGFIDEIPVEYEEAAMIDGYTRFEAFRKIVIPQSVTGMAATAVFCFITAWNEYAFALVLTARRAQTAPPFIPSQVGSGLPDWTAIAAGTVLFLIPVVIFTFMLRNHLLRGVTFGAIRK